MKVKKTVANKTTRFADKNKGNSPIWLSVITISCVYDSLQWEQTILLVLAWQISVSLSIRALFFFPNQIGIVKFRAGKFSALVDDWRWHETIPFIKMAEKKVI